MKLASCVTLSVLLATVGPVHGQQPAAGDSSDVHYYDRWPGVWHRVEGERIDSLPTFEVRRGPGNSFLENWWLVIDGKRTPSFGLRSWDKATGTWRLVWVADPDFFQIWDGIKQPEGWHIIRAFGEGSAAFLSRQGWVLSGADRLVRTIERSTDGGRSWTVRSREVFQRVSGNP